MAQISDIKNPWRNLLLQTPASFRGVEFHVDSGTRISGRRTVVHEYPKKDEDYAEDMGRSARRFQFSGYLIYRPSNPRYNYVAQRIKLIKALEDADAGQLIHPVHGRFMAMCDRYSMIENRERGGYTQFEMSFVEAGTPANSRASSPDTKANVDKKSEELEKSGLGGLDNITADEMQRRSL